MKANTAQQDWCMVVLIFDSLEAADIWARASFVFYCTFMENIIVITSTRLVLFCYICTYEPFRTRISFCIVVLISLTKLNVFNTRITWAVLGIGQPVWVKVYIFYHMMTSLLSNNEEAKCHIQHYAWKPICVIVHVNLPGQIQIYLT